MLIPAPEIARVSAPRKKPFYTGLSFQVLLGVAIAILLGYISPAHAVAMKPLGDAFIRLITMIITLVIFCTLVTGIAGMEDMKKVGRVGGKALLYFELVSTLALLIGLVVGNAVHPGSGFNVNPATLDARAVAEYADRPKPRASRTFSCTSSPPRSSTRSRGETSFRFSLFLFSSALRCLSQDRAAGHLSTSWTL